MNTPSPARPVDFPQSAVRHFADAKLLESAGRFANSGHLYGLGSECGLKALLVSFGLQTDRDGSPIKLTTFREHINVFPSLGNTLVLFLSGRGGAHYLAMIPSIQHFADWRVEHRYFSESSIPQSFANWKVAAEEVGAMLDQLRTEGRL